MAENYGAGALVRCCSVKAIFTTPEAAFDMCFVNFSAVARGVQLTCNGSIPTDVWRRDQRLRRWVRGEQVEV
jgi:hypothetical protein